MKRRFVLKGNICYSESAEKLRILEHGFILCNDGICQDVTEHIPEDWRMEPVRDYGNRIIIPGLVNLHVHAPWYSFRGMGTDLELSEWLERRAFPEEARYADPEYADRAYTIFTDNLRKGATTRACIFGTPHLPATRILMEKLEKTGLRVMVGKANMDRNTPEFLREADAETSLQHTLQWLEETKTSFKRVKPVLTPTFLPACSDRLLEGLKAVQTQWKLPVQSHLAACPEEIQWVKELCPGVQSCGDAYERAGLFGGEDCPTVMSHCVYSDAREQERMKAQGIWVAHCPQADMSLAFGIAPVKEFLERGLKVGLGTDMAGGSRGSVFKAMTDAIQASKLRYRIQDSSRRPLTFENVFYMATMGGGSFFGKVGSFEPGYELDAVILDDRKLPTPRKLSVRERLERIICLGDDRQIDAKYVAGWEILCTKNIY